MLDLFWQKLNFFSYIAKDILLFHNTTFYFQYSKPSPCNWDKVVFFLAKIGFLGHSARLIKNVIVIYV